MDELVFKQFKVAKDFFIRNVEAISTEEASAQPDGFNNTIHWQIGHVLTFTEQLMFGFPEKTTYLPVNYVELFGNGTKPADWNGEVPSLEELIIQLKDQSIRLQQIPSEQLKETLQKPFMEFKTFGELAGLAVLH
ncbi:MAG TPA: DinB family protein, partial [Niallia sp.]|nr:DinB family protein [Niallia sp.]